MNREHAVKRMHEEINREALRLRVSPVIIKMVMVGRNVNVKVAVHIVERELNRVRESKFDF